MTSSHILGRLFALAALTLAATGAFSQAPKYDPSTETTFKGVVEQLKLVPPGGTKSVVYLLVKSTPDNAEVFLCPKSFLDQMGVTFKTDDAIEITGSRVKQGGTDLTLAREIIKNGETLTLRFKDGKPAW